jgi:hypothetical protein
MKNWKTTLSGSCAATGLLLFGYLQDEKIQSAFIDMPVPGEWKHRIGLAALLFSAAGVFFGHFFSIDASAEAKDATAQDTKIQANTDAIAKSGIVTKLILIGCLILPLCGCATKGGWPCWAWQKNTDQKTRAYAKEYLRTNQPPSTPKAP